jgi:hypothetical protein
MYAYAQVEKLVNESARTILKDPVNFAVIEPQAAILAAGAAGVDSAAAPEDWMLMPFVWILDYIASNRIGSLSPEQIAKFKDQYKNAMTLLAKPPVKNGTMTSHVAEIEMPYDLD